MKITKEVKVTIEVNDEKPQYCGQHKRCQWFDIRSMGCRYFDFGLLNWERCKQCLDEFGKE